MTIRQSKINPIVNIMERENATGMGNQSNGKKRVATYCRVSTDLNEQQSSMESQIKNFNVMIERHNDWEFAGIYVDEGISGTNAVKREGFMRMIADCEAGMIDMILTKSISRFARNTLECLQYVRLLKSMGINVHFEKEKINSADALSEALLSILAAVAQEESRNTSENLKWSFRKRCESGQAAWFPLYGYRKDGDIEYIVAEEEARVVRYIFSSYANGCSLPEIVRDLSDQGIRSGKGRRWQPTTVANVLSNERYVGDIRMQKYYVEDYLTHRSRKNDSMVLPSYYIRDHHPAIVSRDLYDVVQLIRRMKDLHFGSTQYPYYGTLICPTCGEKMIRHIPPNKRRGAVWTCSARCTDYMFREPIIDVVVRRAFANLEEERLRELSEDRDASISQAAINTLKWKDYLIDDKRIEYIHLYCTIEKITFPKWSTAEIFWKCGLKSYISVEYKHISDAPHIEALTDEQMKILMNDGIGSFQIRRAFENRFTNDLVSETRENVPRHLVYAKESIASAAQKCKKGRRQCR